MATREYESVASLQLWRVLERFACDAEWSLNKKLLTYFQGLSPAPEPEEYAQAKRARAMADRQFRQIFKTPARSHIKERVDRPQPVGCLMVRRHL